MPEGFDVMESERVRDGAGTAIGVDQFGDECGAVLFSADAGRVGYQREYVARQLSGLPFSRAESLAVSGKRGAFDLGAVWGEDHGRWRTGGAHAWRCGIQSYEAQFCGGVDTAGGGVSAGVAHVRVGRA